MWFNGTDAAIRHALLNADQTIYMNSEDFDAVIQFFPRFFQFSYPVLSTNSKKCLSVGIRSVDIIILFGIRTISYT